MSARVLMSFLLLLATVLGWVGPGWAQTYRWVDDQGGIHYSQGLESIPARYRSSAVPVREPTPSPSAPTPSAPEGAQAPAQGTAAAQQPKGTGGAQIRFRPGEPIMVTARINDSGTAQLLLDTGASVTTISPRVLAAMGISFRDAQRGTIKGVTGEARVLAVKVDNIEVGGARFGPLMVVSHDADLGLGRDGLLGRDFLDNFTVTIDTNAGIVTLVPK